MPIHDILVSSEKSEPRSPPTGGTTSGWTWVALVVTGAGVAGSLFLSLGMELKPCPLCFYQRALMMSVFGVLGVGLLTRARYAAQLSILVLPSAVAGLGVAGF